MYKVGIIGPESTGKSTLAKELAKQFRGLYVPEYAREFVERKGSTEVTYDELCGIARHQIEEITSLPFTGEELCSIERPVDGRRTKPEVGLYFFDTELIVTKVWFEYAFGQVPEWMEEAVRRYPMDCYLLTYPDIPWIPDPARCNGSEEIRLELFDRYEREIKDLDKPYFIITH